MKIKIILYCVLVFLLALPLLAAPPKGKLDHMNNSATVDNATYVDANLIFMFITNHGNFGRDLGGFFGNDYGSYYPFTSISDIEDNINNAALKTPNYASGIWIGGVVDGDTLVAISEYSSEFVPGPMAGGTFQPDAPEYRVYKLYSDSLKNNPNQDYIDYMNYAVDQGAPTVVDGEGDLVPDMIGDQMLWSIYNDADVSQHDNMETDPLGIEIKQTVFAWSQEGSLGSMVFVKYQIFNKGVNTINDFYISLWADPDLGTSSDDLVGCDTITSLGFVYNEDEFDSQYNGTPPAMGFDFFQGPLRAKTIDDPVDAIGRMWGETYTDSVNLGMVSFNKYKNGTDPDNFRETYKYMLGLDGKNDIAYVYNGDTLKYQHSGDPVLGTGDLDPTGEDKRWMQTTGPLTFVPGDSTEILAAVIVGQGSTVQQSIQVLKELDVFAQKLYEDGFNPPAPPARPKVTVSNIADEIAFSWGDTSEVDQGDYEFEGYSVWQGESANGPWTLLSTYDVINDKTDALIDTAFNLEAGIKLPVVKRPVKNTGLNYHYIATEDKLLGEPFRNYSTYYFRVSAFSFAYIVDDTLYQKEDGTIIPTGDRFLESSTILTISPESPLPGVDPAFASFDTLEVTHTSTAPLSDGFVVPMVMDPLALTGDTYEVTFGVDGGGTYWTLTNTTTSEVLIEKSYNQTGDNDYFVVDGILVKVQGPAPGVKTCDVFDCEDDPSTWGWDIPNGTRRFTWSAANFGFEGFRGALGWAGPGDVYGDSDPIDPATLPEVLIKLATVSTDGTFDPNDENVSYAYRYGRGFTNAPARPEFAPYMINTVDGGYSFQDFEKSCPLSAWNMDTDPPTRLAVGYLENNGLLATLDGKYFPPESDSLAAWETDMIDGNGPREWLWIFNVPYSETVNPDYQTNALVGNEGVPADVPVMYWATWARRGHDVPFSPGGTGEDEFVIYPSRVNSVNDVFTFTGTAPTATQSQADLNAIKAVPNPYYINSSYDPSVGSYEVKFTHLPEKCTIRIFNLSGAQVATIEKDDPTTTTAGWNLLTSTNLPAASGIYIYVVEAPGYGEKIGKMAIFVEQEVLRIY